jgi:acetyl esterase
MDLSAFDEEVALEWAKAPPPDVDLSDVELARRAFARHFRELSAQAAAAAPPAAREDTSVLSLSDGHRVPIRIYRPRGASSGRGLLYLHSGAFVLGDLDIEDARCCSLAGGANCTVVSVDYRLAPEHLFPAPLEDCRSALHWLLEHAEDLGVDPGRLGIAGCSAGGALAASLAQLCRDLGGPRLRLQMLLYPVLDAALETASMKATTAADFEDTERMWEHYLGAPRSRAAKYASPASREDLAGLPPAYVCCGELDDLRDEAIAYAQRLLTAGVSVELEIWAKVPHAFEIFVPSTRLARLAVDRQVEAVRRFLG